MSLDLVEMKTHEIVAEIVKDLSDRAGLDSVWFSIDPRDRNEILDSWKTIVRKKLLEPF